jgi:hypothetical protein
VFDSYLGALKRARILHLDLSKNVMKVLSTRSENERALCEFPVCDVSAAPSSAFCASDGDKRTSLCNGFTANIVYQSLV